MSEITTRYENDIAIIDVGSRKLIGEKEDYELWTRVEEVLDGGCRKIILDLSGLKWSNSTGIGIMISAWTMAQKEKAELVVVMSSRRLEDIFKVTNLSMIMRTFESVDEAVKGMS
ncbi:MAG: STAS domain-containing protein [Candidatus Krumholzibacteria bacterium]|nr:STAS domain-containing protein [Candidatus Krumholzibacteria bacterium]